MANRRQIGRGLPVSRGFFAGLSGALLVLATVGVGLGATKSSPAANVVVAGTAVVKPPRSSIFIGGVLRAGHPDEAARAMLKKTLLQMGEEPPPRVLFDAAACVDPSCARRLREQGGYLLLAQISAAPLGMDDSRMWLIDVKTERALTQNALCAGCGVLPSLSRQAMALVERLAAPDWVSLQGGFPAPPLAHQLESGSPDRASRVPVQLRVNAAAALSRVAASLTSAVKHQVLNMGYLPKDSTAIEDTSAQLKLDLIHDDTAPRDSQLSEVILSLSDNSSAHETVLSCVTMDCKAPTFPLVVQRAVAVLLDKAEEAPENRSGRGAGLDQSPPNLATSAPATAPTQVGVALAEPVKGETTPSDLTDRPLRWRWGSALAGLSAGSFVAAGVLALLNGHWAGDSQACSTGDAGLQPVINAKGHCSLWTVPAYGTLVAVGGALLIADVLVWTLPSARKPAPVKSKLTASWLPGGRS